MAEIQSISIRHEAIMDYLIANPVVKLGDVAMQFQVTQGWLSQIIHSDAFQTMLREKQGVVFHHSVLPLREKMTTVAHLALDKLIETLPMETETKTVAQVAEGVLDRLGFGSKAPMNQTNITQVNVMRAEIEEAQKLLGRNTRPVLGVVIDGERAPIAIQPTRESFLGKGDEVSPAIPGEDEKGEWAEAEARA